MTDMPSFGILCCGRDLALLSRAVKCCGEVSTCLKDSGYTLCGYHTALLSRTDRELVRLCREKLYHLSKSCDLVVTIGGDGFDPDDIIPELTVNLCDSEAVFFSTNLSGAGHIGNYDRNRRRIPLTLSSDTSSFPASTRERSSEKAFLLPSRSKAGCLGKSLILNLRCDEAFIRAVLPALLPSISFAVAGLSGRDPIRSKNLTESMKKMLPNPT